jgi:ABC-2 type transport system ATP-binding protein
MRATPWIKSVTIEQNTVRLSMEKAETRVPAVVQAAVDCGVSLSSVNIRKPSLDDVFIHYTGKTIRESGNDEHAAKKKRRSSGRR